MTGDRSGREAAPRTFEEAEDIGSNDSANRHFDAVLSARLSRRGLLGGLAAAGALAAGGSLTSPLAWRAAEAAAGGSTLGFAELAHGVDERHHVADGYDAQVVIRWGDKVLADAPDFDPAAQTAAAQGRQFGYNNDFIGYFPLPQGSDSSDHGLLVVNHEYTNGELMFSGLTEANKLEKIAAAQVDVELAAHGLSVVEVRKEGGAWKVVEGSRYARRITATTPTEVSGPAAGHALLRTKADPTGTRVLGTLNNCAGGWTPWGTVLTGEENFNGYFGGDAENAPDKALYKRYGVSAKSWYSWWKHHDRFDVTKEPNEPNRFGWIVEFDPYDPQAVPKKRTALGRFKHEGATSALAPDGRVVLYSGDDERFDYLYRFVTSGRYDPQNRAANLDLLDAGTLSVARFDADGTLEWLPLVHGQGPLTAANGFADQAELLVKARLAADLLGATKMDRPEDVEPSPLTGKVYVALTNNTRRKAEQADGPNPRGPNPFGHVVEIVPPGADGARDHTAGRMAWNVLLRCGNPARPEDGAQYHPATSANGWLASPDNVAFDPRGRLWITTDNGDAWTKVGFADGVYACDVEGPGRGLTKHFFRVPIGAEMCGPCFTPDGRTLFVAVQHVAADGVKPEQNFDNPATRWPDFKDGMPPRPSVVAIVRKDGGEIGG